MRSCTRLLSSTTLDPDTLHANLRLCLRLSRQSELSAVFYKEGGLQTLLSLTQKSSFKGFTSLASLLFRHCLEDPRLLRQSMESVVRAVLHVSPSNTKETRPQGQGMRELHYVLRRLGPCSCRDSDLFMDSAVEALRLTSLPPSPESLSTSQRLPQVILKTSGPPKTDPVPFNELQKNIVNLLIDHLCADSFEDSSEKGEVEMMKAEEEVGEVRPMLPFSLSPMVRRGGGRRRHGSYRRQVTGNDEDDDLASEDMNVDAEPASEVSQAGKTPTTSSAGEGSSGVTEKLPEKPLLSKPAILRLLAELVEAYPSCAKVIAESSRKIKIGGQPAKVY